MPHENIEVGLFEGRSAGVARLNSSLQRGLYGHLRFQTVGWLLGELKNGFDRFQSELVLTRGLLQVHPDRQRRFVLDVVVAENGVQIRSHLGRKSVERMASACTRSEAGTVME